MNVQSLRRLFESFLEITFKSDELIDFDTELESVDDRMVVKYIFYTMNHRYVIHLVDWDGLPYCYVSMKPRIPETGSSTLPVFDVWEGVASHDNFSKVLNKILASETVKIMSRQNPNKLKFVGEKIEWLS